VDLRPGALSYSRAAFQRRLHGDAEGAIALYQLAIEATPPEERESAAWCHVQLAETWLSLGQAARAGGDCDAALALLPEFHLALAAKAKARAAAGDLAGAIDLYRRAQARVPLPDTVIALGDLYAQAGRAAEARQQYALYDAIARNAGPAGSGDLRQRALFL